jgi:hypothetical protein
MKMSLNFKFFYNYFTPLFFEFSGSGVSINANNSVLIVVYLTSSCVNWAFFGMSGPV